MKIDKSAGTTDSERALASLCERSFLGFWSYANLFRDQGGGKELVDLVVVCGEHIILFSDKSCDFPETGDDKRDWARWYRRAVGGSAKQIAGAERWIRRFPDRIFMDARCTLKFPLPLPSTDQCKFHRVVVALGAVDRCKAAMSTKNGSLYWTPSIVGDEHWNVTQHDVRPFHIGQTDDSTSVLHVLNDFTLPLLLSELDTITDFVDYLEFKEQLFRTINIGTVAGEENLLSFYLSGFLNTDYWDRLKKEATGNFCLDIGSAAWEEYENSITYHERKYALQYSRIWDGIVNEFATHSFGGTLIEGPKPVADNEYFFRHMAKESRIARGFLTALMLERWSFSAGDRVHYRIAESPSNAKLLYVFVFVPNLCQSESEYREIRQEYLTNYCFLVGRKNTNFELVLGIATQVGNDVHRTFDVFGIENGPISSEMHSILDEVEVELGVNGEGTIHRINSATDGVSPARNQ